MAKFVVDTDIQKTSMSLRCANMILNNHPGIPENDKVLV